MSKIGGLEIDVDGNGYVLPDGMLVSPNIIGMKRSPKYWKNPDKFDMNRLSNKDRKFNRKLDPTLMNIIPLE